MPFDLPPLPFDRSALEPHVPGVVIDRLRERQRAHLAALDALMPAVADAGTDGEPAPSPILADVVRTTQGACFHHAAHAWNIDFCLRGLAPPAAGGVDASTGDLLAAIVQRFGSPAALCARFDRMARAAEAPGWTWLVRRREGGLGLVRTMQAATPITGDDLPLLAYWSPEDADEAEATRVPLDAFWHVADWRGVSARWAGARR